MTLPTSDARNDVLARLRHVTVETQSLFRTTQQAPSAGVPSPVAPAAGDRLSLAQQFGAKLEEALGSYEIVEQTVDVAQCLVRQISRAAEGAATPCSEILSWDPAELPIPDLDVVLKEHGVTLLVPDDLHDQDCRTRAATPDIGLTGVDAAFAGTGSVVLLAGPGKSRSASLLPLHYIALVPFSRIQPTFEAWLASLRQQGHLEEFLRNSRQMFFFTGPSKSADIELNLTLGVHGPKSVHAIVFDDTS